jgi:hypothetical protein
METPILQTSPIPSLHIITRLGIGDGMGVEIPLLDAMIHIGGVGVPASNSGISHGPYTGFRGPPYPLRNPVIIWTMYGVWKTYVTAVFQINTIWDKRSGTQL